jgi:hypothetical protein
MDLSWKTKLKPDQRANPILEICDVPLNDSYLKPTNEMLNVVFPSEKHQLKTWGRKARTKTHDPHWIGVKHKTPLHYDPAYPRYSHHLVLRADGHTIRGMSKNEVAIQRGTFYVLDGHSPHQLLTNDKKSIWYLAVSIDSDNSMTVDDVVMVLLEFALTADFFKKEKE